MSALGDMCATLDAIGGDIDGMARALGAEGPRLSAEAGRAAAASQSFAAGAARAAAESRRRASVGDHGAAAQWDREAASLQRGSEGAARVAAALDSAARACLCAAHWLASASAESSGYVRANWSGGGGGSGSGTVVDALGRPLDVVERTDGAMLWRADSREPDVVFRDGFEARDPSSHDLESYVLSNHASSFVGTSRRPDLYKDWGTAYRYVVVAPGGIDVNATLTFNTYRREQEVAFQGGISTAWIAGVQEVLPDGSLGEYIPNPRFNP